MRKAVLSVVALALAAVPFLPSQAKGDTFYGVFVPMPTPVTLTSVVATLTIGTKTTITSGGGDGTGGYSFNNLSNSFCSITTTGVVTANFPGSCRFTVTRLASGKYLDTTSSALNITALPEPDKSVISVPVPDPTPTVEARATPTPTATPQSSQAPTVTKRATPLRDAVVIDTSINDMTVQVNVPLKKVSGISASLAPANGVSTYKFSWAVDPAAVTYSINLVTPVGKKALTSNTTFLSIDELGVGEYSIEIQAIDAKGKLSIPTVSKFSIPPPRLIKLVAPASLIKPVIDNVLAASLDRFSLQTTVGTAMKLSIEYPKSKLNDANVLKLSSAVEKYLAGKRRGSSLKITLSPVNGAGDIAVIRGVGEKKTATLSLHR